MAKDNKKFLPFKNWIYLLIVIILMILGFLYILSWKNVKEKEKYMDSYLVSTNTVSLSVTKPDEITQMLQEVPENYFVYVSYTGNGDVFKLEKKLKTIIDNYGLHDIFYFVDVTDSMNDELFIDNLNDSFNTTEITNVPCIIYYNHGIVKKVIVNDDGIFNIKNFEKVLKDQEFEKK